MTAVIIPVLLPTCVNCQIGQLNLANKKGMLSLTVMRKISQVENFLFR